MKNLSSNLGKLILDSNSLKNQLCAFFSLVIAVVVWGTVTSPSDHMPVH